MEIQVNKQAYQVGLKINKWIKWVISFIQKALIVMFIFPMIYFLLLSIDSSDFLNSWSVGEAFDFATVFAIPFIVMIVLASIFFEKKLSKEVVLKTLCNYCVLAWSFYTTMRIVLYFKTVGVYAGIWTLFVIWVLGMMLVIVGLIVLSLIVKLICLLIDYKKQPYHFFDFLDYYYRDENVAIITAIKSEDGKVIWERSLPRLKIKILHKNQRLKEKGVK